MLTKIQNFLRDEEGASAVEYGLIVGLLAVVIVTVLGQTGTNLNSIFGRVRDALNLGGAAGG